MAVAFVYLYDSRMTAANRQLSRDHSVRSNATKSSDFECSTFIAGKLSTNYLAVATRLLHSLSIPHLPSLLYTFAEYPVKIEHKDGPTKILVCHWFHAEMGRPPRSWA